jgi:hypothetical protein
MRVMDYNSLIKKIHEFILIYIISKQINKQPNRAKRKSLPYNAILTHKEQKIERLRESSGERWLGVYDIYVVVVSPYKFFIIYQEKTVSVQGKSVSYYLSQIIKVIGTNGGTNWPPMPFDIIQ